MAQKAPRQRPISQPKKKSWQELKEIVERLDAVEVETSLLVIERATEVIGDRGEALRWLGTPVRALNYSTPISLLNERTGAEAVLTELGRLEHGIF